MSYPFIQARNYTKGRIKKIRLIVCHDMEAPEAHATAENVAKWMAGSTAPQASFHFGVDDNSIVQSVKVTDTAWHAPGANADGIGIEHAGYAKQTRLEWVDPFSRAELALSAKLTAKLAKDYRISVKHLTVAELKAGKSGFIGHWDATVAFSGGQGHTDPGPRFPWDVYMTMVAAEYSALGGVRWTKKRLATVAVSLGMAAAVFGGVTQIGTAPPVVKAPAPVVVVPKVTPTVAPKPDVVPPVFKSRVVLRTLGTFPLPRGNYYAASSTNPRVHSGYLGKDRYAITLIQRAVGAIPDGRVGAITTAKIKAKQKALRLTADGLVGPATWNLLRRS